MEIINIGARLSDTARTRPDQVGVVMPGKHGADGKREYETITFAELEEDTNRIAAGLSSVGIQPGMRIALMVKPSIDFIALVFALFKAGVVIILIDPGMGRKNLLRCLDEAKPEGFVAIPIVQAVRLFCGRRYRNAKHNVTVGRRWFWGGPTLKQLRQTDASDFQSAQTTAEDSAAIIFTTGSTGPPKGVHYRHGNFHNQVERIREFYDVQPGELDLSGFPLFALFNAAMGVTTVIPDMDPTRPADVDPRNVLEAVHDWKITQSFGSPAIWNAVGKYCSENGKKLPTLKRILSAGAPVPPHVLQWMREAMPSDGDMHTPYGATEALPVASISATEVLGETAKASVTGAGTCVGRRFAGIDWKVIAISDEPIGSINDVEALATGEIGELIVRGPVVTREYATRTDANPLAKIADGDQVWHRMGDVGYLDDGDRFWFCGRKAHRVETKEGPMYTIRCEAIYNAHERIYRSALVGIGVMGQQKPVMICQPWPGRFPESEAEKEELRQELQALGRENSLTQGIETLLLHPSLPVDIRHNAKIFREKLAVWATSELKQR